MCRPPLPGKNGVTPHRDKLVKRRCSGSSSSSPPALCLFAVLRWFGDAFSVLDLDVRMSRTWRSTRRGRVDRERQLADVPLTEAAASFDGNSAAQTFIELEGGGKPALKPLLGGDEFALYRWPCACSRRASSAKCRSPSRRTADRPASSRGARGGGRRGVVVRGRARGRGGGGRRDWGVDFGRYRALSASSMTRPGKRVDHEFVYERRLERAADRGRAPPLRLGRRRRPPHAAAAFRLRARGVRRRLQDHALGQQPDLDGRDPRRRTATASADASIGSIWLMRRHACAGSVAKWAAVVATLIAGAGLAGISVQLVRLRHRDVGVDPPGA